MEEEGSLKRTVNLPYFQKRYYVRVCGRQPLSVTCSCQLSSDNSRSSDQSHDKDRDK